MVLGYIKLVITVMADEAPNIHCLEPVLMQHITIHRSNSSMSLKWWEIQVGDYTSLADIVNILLMITIKYVNVYSKSCLVTLSAQEDLGILIYVYVLIL